MAGSNPLSQAPEQDLNDIYEPSAPHSDFVRAVDMIRRRRRCRGHQLRHRHFHVHQYAVDLIVGG